MAKNKVICILSCVILVSMLLLVPYAFADYSIGSVSSRSITSLNESSNTSKAVVGHPEAGQDSTVGRASANVSVPREVIVRVIKEQAVINETQRQPSINSGINQPTAVPIAHSESNYSVINVARRNINIVKGFILNETGRFIDVNSSNLSSNNSSITPSFGQNSIKSNRSEIAPLKESSESVIIPKMPQQKIEYKGEAVEGKTLNSQESIISKILRLFKF